MSTSQWKANSQSISDNTTDMNLNAGDIDSERTVTLSAGDNEIETGGVVAFDAEGYIYHPVASDEVVIGTVLRESDQKADSEYTVNVFGTVFAAQLDDQETTDVTPGDTLYPSADYPGAFTGSDEVSVANTDDADVDLYLNHPIALEAGLGGDDDGELDGDVILGFYR